MTNLWFLFTIFLSLVVQAKSNETKLEREDYLVDFVDYEATATSRQSLSYPSEYELSNRHKEAASKRKAPPSENENASANSARPPYGGTVYIDKGMVKQKHPSAHRGGKMTYAGRGCRILWNHGWVQDERMHIFDVSFTDKVKTQIWVESKFSKKRSRQMAKKTAFYLGQVPQFLRRGVRAVMIAKGQGGFGGNQDGHINLYDSSYREFIRNGFFAEVLIHEGAHATLDKTFYSWTKWSDAVNQDPGYISDYAEDYPRREDVSETVVPWVGAKLELLRKNEIKKIKTQIPNRLKVFDNQNYNLFPLDGSRAKPIKNYEYKPLGGFYNCDNKKRDHHHHYEEFGATQFSLTGKYLRSSWNTTATV